MTIKIMASILKFTNEPNENHYILRLPQLCTQPQSDATDSSELSVEVWSQGNLI